MATQKVTFRDRVAQLRRWASVIPALRKVREGRGNHCGGLGFLQSGFYAEASEGSASLETGIHFIFEATELGIHSPSKTFNIRHDLGGFRINFGVHLFQVAFQLTQFGGNEVRQELRTDWSALDIE